MVSNGLHLINETTYFETKTKEIGTEQVLISIITSYNIKNATVVAYLDNEVLIGSISNDMFTFPENKKIDPRYLQNMRVFNSNKELYIWKRKRPSFNLRYREDSDERLSTKKEDIIEVQQKLLGSVKRVDGEWVYLEENKGQRLVIPRNEIMGGIKEHDEIYVKTRNYIDYNYNGQAGYVDSRFMQFVKGGC
jgi:CRISPR-associated protein (TIGR03984 family)